MKNGAKKTSVSPSPVMRSAPGLTRLTLERTSWPVCTSNERFARLETLGDDFLVVCACLFLCATYLTFWALRTRSLVTMRRLSLAVDGLFLAALTMLVGVGFLMVYSIL